MSANAQFLNKPGVEYVQISTANTNRDGSTGTYSAAVFTGAANGGSFVEKISIVAAGTTTAGVVRVFLSLDAGTTKRLIKEVLVSAITPSASVAVFSSEVTLNLKLRDSSASLYFSTHNAESFNIVCQGGDF